MLNFIAFCIAGFMLAAMFLTIIMLLPHKKKVLQDDGELDIKQIRKLIENKGVVNSGSERSLKIDRELLLSDLGMCNMIFEAYKKGWPNTEIKRNNLEKFVDSGPIFTSLANEVGESGCYDKISIHSFSFGDECYCLIIVHAFGRHGGEYLVVYVVKNRANILFDAVLFAYSGGYFRLNVFKPSQWVIDIMQIVHGVLKEKKITEGEIRRKRVTEENKNFI